MNILAVDSSTNSANVTLDINNSVINKSVDNEITHSEKLLPLIDECLKEGNVKTKDIDVFSITTGPGSFTGIRIGIATIKAFSKVSNAKIFAVNSLEVLAYEAINKNVNEGYVLSLLDAKNSRVYYGLYKIEKDIFIPVIEPANDKITDVITTISEYFNKLNNTLNIDKIPLNIVGEINDLYSYDTLFSFENEIELKNTMQVSLIDASISSKTLAIMTKEYITNPEIKNSKYMFDYANLDATYIRPSQAERIKKGEEI